ncbi:MAG: ribosome biogenesis GTPase YlqF [Clostridia bacterium]|nr:ribosome biogenesis GTPase YlqF [Clostridia bacterium]MBR1675872.1 ribosome biogenesis GTPase YlqF [Clostridia bacterium]
MENDKKINWFPGHMAKAMRKTEEDIKLCDGVIYVLDARAPYACINLKLMKIFGNKPIVYALNKCDTISQKSANAIVNDFKANGKTIECVNGLLKKDVERIKSACKSAMSEKIERDRAKGVKRTLRFLVAGIPNTGKSTIINTLCGSKRAETGDKAGVTRANKWLRMGDFDLLDTPGTMPPSMENQAFAKHLAYIGAINDDILDFEGLTLDLLAELSKIAPNELQAKYKLKSLDNRPIDLFDEICKNRGFIIKGGEVDYTRGARAVIDDLRKGRIGKICFEEKP